MKIKSLKKKNKFTGKVCISFLVSAMKALKSFTINTLYCTRPSSEDQTE